MWIKIEITYARLKRKCTAFHWIFNFMAGNECRVENVFVMLDCDTW